MRSKIKLIPEAVSYDGQQLRRQPASIDERWLWIKCSNESQNSDGGRRQNNR